MKDLKDLRPISLVGGLYKILSKVLATRIKRVMVTIISQSQSTCVEGRQILDVVLIANEVVDSILRIKECGLVCKLDIEKAYDSINWDFVFQVMDRMGFGNRWMSWIKWCVSTASFSILFNGSLVGFFQISRGLRQGDPISPYLFVISMEALSLLIQRAVDGNYLSSIKVAIREGEGEVISHLFYADDTLLFYEPNKDQMKFLSWILMWFEAMPDLRINLSKSEIIPVGPIDNVAELAMELDCGIGSFPSSYLGLPLGAPHKAIRVWDSVEERFRKRMASWKMEYISKSGKITLIRSTLSSLPIYHLSLFRMPQKICSSLERIQRQFLWGEGEALRRSLISLNGPQFAQRRKKGGLGLRKFSRLNKALLRKWSWRFANERNALWRKVVSSKYGESSEGWHTRDFKGGFGVGLWKEISKEWPLFLQNYAFSLGDNRRIRFWKDVWCGEEALCSLFPTMFSLAVQKDAMVSELWNHFREEGGWAPTFLRPLNDWEMEEVGSFLSFIHRKKIKPEIEDNLLVNESRLGNFSVRTMYNGLDNSVDFDFPIRLVWNATIPSKISFFAWEASWGKVMTLE